MMHKALKHAFMPSWSLDTVCGIFLPLHAIHTVQWKAN